jgi:F-type H+-transporting ATPase subunit epsilon
VAKVRVILPGSGEQAIAVHGGFVEVGHDRVIVLSDVAELPERIDVERAREAKSRAETALQRDEQDEAAAAALARADLRLDVAGAATTA